MSIYKIIKISILLGTGVIVACSADKTETKSQVSTQVEQAIPSNKLENPMTATIDPRTGKFVSKPALDSSNSVVANSVVTTSSYSESKKSPSSAGGTYIEALGIRKKVQN